MAGLLIDEALALFDKVSTNFWSRHVALERGAYAPGGSAPGSNVRSFRVTVSGGSFGNSDFEWLQELCTTYESPHDKNGFFYIVREMMVPDARGIWHMPAVQVVIQKR